jgi:hypothetical protein
VVLRKLCNSPPDIESELKNTKEFTISIQLEEVVEERRRKRRRRRRR